ncbi:MAG: triphosphoribosyl-dephospho-CoA synthase, partial [Bacillota bacterium]
MLVVEDSNVIGRHGLEALDYVRECAQRALAAGGMMTTVGKEYIYQMDRDFINKDISPGGAADLLAVTIMMYLMENGRRV